MVLAFGIEADDPLAGLTQVRENELEEITLALTGVTEDEDIGCGLILGTAVEVHEDVRAVLISADIQTVGIGIMRTGLTGGFFCIFFDFPVFVFLF